MDPTNKGIEKEGTYGSTECSKKDIDRGQVTVCVHNHMIDRTAIDFKSAFGQSLIVGSHSEVPFLAAFYSSTHCGHLSIKDK